MKKLNKTVTVLARIFEIFLWIGTAVMLGIFVLSLVSPGVLQPLLEEGSLTVGGFNLNVFAADGSVIMKAVTMIALAGILIMPLGAMICRNICLIFKTTAGTTSFSKGATPFQPDNVRMVREIGIFSIAIPVVELIISVIAQLVIGPEAYEGAVNINSFFFGLVILCLSQFFAYGVSLQEEVDGLL